jgi:hypothetical protein
LQHHLAAARPYSRGRVWCIPAEAPSSPAAGGTRAARGGPHGGGCGYGDTRKQLRAFSLENVTAGQVRAVRSCGAGGARAVGGPPRPSGASWNRGAVGRASRPSPRWNPASASGHGPASRRLRRPARRTPRNPALARFARSSARSLAALTGRPHPHRRSVGDRGLRLTSSGPARRPGRCRRPARRPQVDEGFLDGAGLELVAIGGSAVPQLGHGLHRAPGPQGLQHPAARRLQLGCTGLTAAHIHCIGVGPYTAMERKAMDHCGLQHLW